MNYYAWSDIVTEFNEYGQVTKTFKCGEKVSQDLLGVTKENWQDLIDSGSVRTEEYPENLPAHMSPAENRRSKIVPRTNSSRELRLPVTNVEDKPSDSTAKVAGLG